MPRVEAAADRIVAGVLGLALGDALGAPFEFRRAPDVPDPMPAFELPWMGLPPGATTDDTAMARNLWTSLAASGGDLDLDDVLRRHLDVVRDRRRPTWAPSPVACCAGGATASPTRPPPTWPSAARR